MNKPNIYTGHVRSHYVPKNKLQKAISDFLDTWDGVSFPAKKLPEMKKKLTEKIAELNEKHSRSTPAKFSFHYSMEGSRKTVIFIHGLQAIDFVFISGILENYE